MKNSLNEVQRKLLEMMKWFHQFCQDNNLRYYVIGGTMLGAIRHQGFIPWDDDIDVGMPREDYDNLLQLTQQYDKTTHYFVESIYTGNADFMYPYAKLYDTKTTLIESVRPPIKRGIYIDIFPLDGIGENLEEAYKNFLPLKHKMDFLCTRVCVLNKKRNFYKNAAIILSKLIPDRVVDNHKLIKEIEKICKLRSFDLSSIVGNLVGNWGKREIMPRTFFGTPTEYQFEDTKVLGVEDYHNYLNNLYGNYMELPPKEKQQSHHSYLLCNLDKPYIEE